MPEISGICLLPPTLVNDPLIVEGTFGMRPPVRYVPIRGTNRAGPALVLGFDGQDDLNGLFRAATLLARHEGRRAPRGSMANWHNHRDPGNPNLWLYAFGERTASGAGVGGIGYSASGIDPFRTNPHSTVLWLKSEALAHIPEGIPETLMAAWATGAVYVERLGGRSQVVLLDKQGKVVDG